MRCLAELGAGPSVGVLATSRGASDDRYEASEDRSRDEGVDSGGSYLFNTTPSTEDLLENEVTESFFCFLTKGPPLRPGGEGTTSLSKIVELVNRWHQHSVDVGFTEEGRNVRDDWGNVQAVELPGLTGMTSRDKPLDIVFQHWPPETVT